MIDPPPPAPTPALPDREEDDENDLAVEHLVVEGHAPSTTTTTTGDQQQQQQTRRCSCCFDAAYHDPLLPCTCSPSCYEDEDDDEEDEDEDEKDEADDEEAMDVEGEEEEEEKEKEEEHMDTTAVVVVEKKKKEKEEEEDEKVEKVEEMLLSCLVMRCNVSCHACKVLQPRLWVCPRAPGHRWCERCLANRFGVAFDDAPAWPGLATARGCPACRGHCPCAACRRRSGQPRPNRRAGRPRRTTTTTTAATAAAKAKAKAAQCEGGGGERRERGFVRLAMHEDPAAGHHHDHDHHHHHHEENWTKVLDRDAFRSSLVFRKSFLSPAEGERLVEVLRGCEDQMRYHRFVVMGSKKTAHLEPRATLCFGATVAYHGVSVVTRPWSQAPPELIALKKKMMDELSVEVNSFLCTRYLNGLQYIGKHADDQANVKDGRVVTVSLGAERDFCFEDRGAGKKWVVSLPHRSLYMMEGDFQKHLEHWIPAAPEVKSERWSITARFLMNTDGSRTTTVEPPGCLTVAERDPFWIAKALRKKQPSFFGHPPQVPVGHVFESFPPVMETGLHPTHVQAMAGTSKEGVRSMKMGRERSLVNMDRLDSIVCFTNGTHSRRGGQPDIDATFSNERNKPWLTSMLSNKPIRVVVSSSTTSPFAPPCGPDGGDKWHYRGLFTCRGAYVVEVAGLYRIYVSLEALSPEHSYRPPPLEHGVVEDCDGKESDGDDGDGDNEGDDDDDDGEKGGAGRKRKRSRGGTTAKKKKKKQKKKTAAAAAAAAALEDDVEVEVDDDDDDGGGGDDGDDAIEVDFPPSRPPAVDGAGPQAEATEAAPCWCWGRESAVAAHVMFGTPPAAANLDLDHRLGYVLAVDEEERLAPDSFAGLPLFQLHAYLIRHRSAHLSDRLALPELLAYLNSLPLFQLRERAVAVHARLRAEPAGRPRIADYLCGLDDLTPAHVGCREPEQGLPCYFLTNACLFDESGGMVSLERVRPGARASVVGRVAGGHPSAADAWVLAAPASTLHLDYGLSGLWLRVARPFPAWLRVVSGSELYAPLFVSTLGKARMAYAAHDHIRRLPPCVRARVTFRWLVKKLRGAHAEAEIASAAAFLYDHLAEEHPGVPCIDHLRTLPRPPEPEPRARAMLVPHWADTAHRLAWVAQQMPRDVAIEPRLGLYAEPPAEREGKRKADPKPPPAPGEPARTTPRKSSPRRRRRTAAAASGPPLPAHDTTRAH